MQKEKSQGQLKRESYDYRKNYIKHNPGLFNSVYFCSQCMKVLSKDEMQVDHIYPISKRFSPNRVINCVAICPVCNKKKTNKTGKFLVKGIIAKVLEEVYVYIQKLIGIALKILYSLTLLILTSLKNGIFESNSVIAKGLFTVIILYLIKEVVICFLIV